MPDHLMLMGLVVCVIIIATLVTVLVLGQPQCTNVKHPDDLLYVGYITDAALLAKIFPGGHQEDAPVIVGINYLNNTLTTFGSSYLPNAVVVDQLGKKLTQGLSVQVSTHVVGHETANFTFVPDADVSTALVEWTSVDGATNTQIPMRLFQSSDLHHILSKAQRY